MAELLNKIPTNLTEYPNSFKRQGAFPLEAYSVFYSMTDAEAYASSNPIAYVGQTLAVVTANTLNASVVDNVTFYIIADPTGTLQEVGKATSGDGKTVKLNDEGKIELAGLDALDANKTYVPSLKNGVLTWDVPDTSTTDGQARAIAALEETVNGKAAVGEPDSEGYQPAVEGLVSKVDNNNERIAAIEGRVDSFATIKYVDDEIDKIEEAIGNLNHFKAEVVDDIAKVTSEGVLYLIKDNDATGVDKYNEYILVGGVATLIGDTTTDLSNYYDKDHIDDIDDRLVEVEETSAAIAGRVGALENIDNATQAELNAYKEEVTTAISTAKQEAITAAKTAEEAKGYAVATEVENTYAKQEYVAGELALRAKTADVNAELAKKIETGTISHSTDSSPETVTVEGTTLKIVVDSYTKKETLDKIKEKITEINGGESAGEVLSQLNSYKETNNAAIGAINTKNDAQDESIAAINGEITALKTRDTELAALIANKADATNVYTKEETNTAITTAINGIDFSPYAKVEDVASEISRIDTAITTNASKVYTKEEADAAFMTQDEVDARINTLIAASDPDNDGNVITNIQNLVEYVENNADEIAGLITSVENNAKNIQTNIENIAGLQTAVNAIVQPKESAEISVGENGELGIKAVSVDKLFIPDGVELILNGGTV
jgi:hypothetical protein